MNGPPGHNAHIHLTPDLGPFLSHPELGHQRTDATSNHIRLAHWRTLLLENDLPGRITSFVHLITRELYGGLPDKAYERLFARELLRYRISHDDFQVIGGANTQDDPLVIEVPALPTICFTKEGEGSEHYVIAIDSNHPGAPVVVPGPMLFSVRYRGGEYETDGAQAFQQGRLNASRTLDMLETEGNSRWTLFELRTREVDEDDDLEDRATWQLFDTLHEEKGCDEENGRSHPLYAHVDFVLHSGRQQSRSSSSSPAQQHQALPFRLVPAARDVSPSPAVLSVRRMLQ
ncbi:hypothetical protein JCM8547_005572 [Rhodosporidiobolus lusitaniae]